MNYILCIKQATLYYQGKCIFKDLHFELPTSKWIALLGPSGVGKTSFLRMIAGLFSSDSQSCTAQVSFREHTSHHDIAYMAQNDLLFPWLTVLQNVLMKIKLQRHSLKDRAHARIKAKEILTQVGLGDYLDYYPHQLSGGMRQRAALARTLIANKSIILMDEPFSKVDAITRYKLQQLAANLLKDKTVLFITHDPTESLRLAHEVYVMQGMPAVIKKVVTLDTTIPRELNDPSVIAKQTALYQQLSHTESHCNAHIPSAPSMDPNA